MILMHYNLDTKLMDPTQAFENKIAFKINTPIQMNKNIKFQTKLKIWN